MTTSNIDGCFQKRGTQLIDTDAAPSCAARSAGLEGLLLSLRGRSSPACLAALQGWREEQYEISLQFPGPALFTLERAAAPLLGVRKADQYPWLTRETYFYSFILLKVITLTDVLLTVMQIICRHFAIISYIRFKM